MDHSCLAYDPVQSLLAVGTSESRFGAGRIYVFGQQRVCKFLGLEPELGASPASYRALAFVGGGSRLVSLDAKSRIVLWDLDSARRVAGTTVAGHVVAMETDPMLDWAFLGTREGDVLAFDLDRERMGQFRLGNLWKMRDQVEQGQPGGAAGRSGGVGGSYLGRSRTTTTAPAQLVGLALHPRDIGKLLVAYTTGAVIYSFKQEAPVKYFEYVLQPGAPGGNAMATDSVRRPRLVQALWHPAGTFILTAHEDGSLVFWDPKDGRVVMARTLYDVKIDQPVPNPSRGGGVAMDPFVRIAWCCKDPNTEDTGLLVAGGQMADVPDKGLTFIELGVTPTYATSSWQVLTEFFRGKRQSSLPVPLGAVVVDFCLIPRASPHFAGAQDPVAVICVLSSGELVTLSFPSGYRISPTNQLHPSLTFVHPFVTRMAVSTLDRGRWLGMVENRSGTGEPLLRGGAEARKPKKRFEGRTIVQAAHADGTIRMWDTGHQDDIENESALQVDLARALDRVDDSDGASVEVTALNMADGTGEFAAGTRNGELVVWRWAGNKYYGNEDAARNMGHASNPGGLTDISARAEPNLKEGLQPYVLYEMLQGPISCVRVSDVGFVGVGSEGGFFSLIDLRGPAVVLHVSMQELAKGEKRSVFLGPGSSSRGSSSGAPGSREYPVVVEFGVMTLEGDGYSSICCFVGTSAGRVATFKILPSGSGYTAKLAGQVTFGDRVIAINPIIADSGKPAAATGPVVAGLRNGQQIHGILVVGE